MKILVPVKRVPDPEAKVKLKDGAIDLANVSWVLNPFDEYAVETALRLTENADDGSRHGEVVVVTVGPADAAAQLRSALAMGADRAILVEGDDADLDARVIVQTLMAVYKKEQPNVVVMGKQAVDGDSNIVGQMLAGKLGLPQATFAATVELAADKASMTIGREVDAGVEFKKVALPAVVTVDLRIVAPTSVTNHITPDGHEYGDGPRYASLKGIMKAKKKPMDKLTFGDLGVEPARQLTNLSYDLPEARAGGVMVADVAELMQKLTQEAKVL